MVQTKRIYLRGREIVHVSAGGAGGEPGGQLESVVEACRNALADEGLSNADVALSRLWMGDRQSAAALDGARDRLLRGDFRAASSSFFSRQRMSGEGVVAVEFYAVRANDRASRKIVTFDPPRRYAHYLAVDDWVFLSGMAEEGETMDAQFDKAFAQVQSALDLEGANWGDVLSASLFLQHGKATPDWMLERFRQAAPLQPHIVTFEMVDELANTPKHLEIEVIAHRKRA